MRYVVWLNALMLWLAMISTRGAMAKTCKKSMECNVTSETCHSLLKICVPKNGSLTVLTSQNKPKAVGCKHNRNCTKGKYCHDTFRKCLDIPVIPTTSTTKPSTQSCRNDSTCGKNRYCHVMFKICLERLTAFPNVTTPPVKYNCTGDKDCHPGQYCQNVTSTCRQVKKLSGSGLPSPSTKP